MRIVVGLALDAGLICLFAAIGRHNHGQTSSVLGVASTAWPFLAGMAAGWLTCLLASGRAPLRAVDGITVLVGTVAIGMALRAMTNAGTALAFIAVTTAFLGAGLLGWRAVAALPKSRRA